MRVLIAEDAALLREGLVRLLTSRDIEVAGAVENATDLLRAVDVDVPDLVITDIRMPPDFQVEGLQAALALRAQYPSLSIVVLSQYVEERYATRLLTSCTSHVGYLLKDRIADVEDFIATLHRVHSGEAVLDPEVVAQLLIRHRDRPLDHLTPRESDVLREMAQGRSNHGIAQALTITQSAVAKHVNAIFSKLNLGHNASDHRRVMAVQHYLQNAHKDQP